MKILFLTLYPRSQPSTRFRVIQLLPFLSPQTKCVIRSVVPEFIFKRLYGSQKFLPRVIFHFFELFIRAKDIILSFKYDVVFLQKGLTTVNYRGLHKMLFLFNKNVVFDFDDAVNFGQISSFKHFPLNLLVDRTQVIKIIKTSAVVIAGNNKLKVDAEELNPKTIFIPTMVDTDYYMPNPERYIKKDRVSILWSGNKSGYVYLKICSKTIRDLSKKYPLDLFVLSDSYNDELKNILTGIDFIFVKWSISNEKNIFNSADIGIMPLYDILWDRRKCAFKTLLYMANGIPSVSSSVGVVKDFIQDRENGFLAAGYEEWFSKLENLITDSTLRKKIGLNGRKTIENLFSSSKWGPEWAKVLESEAGV